MNKFLLCDCGKYVKNIDYRHLRSKHHLINSKSIPSFYHDNPDYFVNVITPKNISRISNLFVCDDINLIINSYCCNSYVFKKEIKTFYYEDLKKEIKTFYYEDLKRRMGINSSKYIFTFHKEGCKKALSGRDVFWSIINHYAEVFFGKNNLCRMMGTLDSIYLMNLKFYDTDKLRLSKFNAFNLEFSNYAKFCLSLIPIIEKVCRKKLRKFMRSSKKGFIEKIKCNFDGYMMDGMAHCEKFYRIYSNENNQLYDCMVGTSIFNKNYGVYVGDIPELYNIIVPLKVYEDNNLLCDRCSIKHPDFEACVYYGSNSLYPM